MTINGIFPGQIAGIMLTFIVLCTISWRSYALIVPSSVGRGITGLRGPNTQLSVASTPQQGMSERIRRIKDVSFEKEVIRDVTAAEFAMVVVGSSRIDYEKLIENLQCNIDSLEVRIQGSTSNIGDSAYVLLQRVKNTKDALENFIQSREYKQRMKDLEVLQEQQEQERREDWTVGMPTTVGDASLIATESIQTPAAAAADPLVEQQKEEIIKEIEDVKQSLSVIIRDDGTLDWDEAISTGRQVGKLGSELLQRLNGKEEGDMSLTELLGQSTVREVETPEILAKKQTVSDENMVLDSLLAERDRLLLSLRARKEASAGVLPGEMQELRQLDVRAKDMAKKIKLFRMDLDMERICVYLQQELESSMEPAEQKLFVAEAALLDKQVSSLYSMQEDAALIDDDELNLVFNEVTDLKFRLGLETSSLVQIDWGSFGSLLTETGAKVRVGLSFYGEGTRMLVSDVQYAWALLVKAVTGTTLKPREVNVVRRTGKDLLTLIPFTVILLVPLTPVGHVLVFSFIQRFFPEFYPSCYTEKRLNLRKLYSEIERKGDRLGGLLQTESLAVEKEKAPLLGLFEGIPKFLSRITKDRVGDDRGA